jgi:ubiquinone/menaquinone biosynthesis C-methylase UbiE
MTADLAEWVERGGAVATIRTACQTGLLDSLSRPAPPAQHAKRLRLDPHAVSLVLDVLVALGIAETKEGLVGAFDPLSSQNGNPVDDVLRTQELWRHLPRFLQTGERYAHMDGSPAERSTSYQSLAATLGRLFENAALDLARKLPPPGQHVLDVGAGSGVWSLSMCARAPKANVCALDLPDVLPAFLHRAASLGLADRVQTIAGDYHSTKLPAASFDRIVLANVLHLETPADATALIARAASALKPRGELVVIDSLAEDDPARTPAHAIYALHLAMRTQRGCVHPHAQIDRWARDAGLWRSRTVRPEARPRNLTALIYEIEPSTPRTPRCGDVPASPG